jgi:hypothetical protein
METSEQRRDRIDAHRDAQTCSICSKHLDYSEGYYTHTHAHTACQSPGGHQAAGADFEAAKARIEQSLTALGFKPKRQQARLGQGGPTKKLIAIIEASAKEHFDTEDVRDVVVHLAPPVWRQTKFDVRRIDGSMLVNGRRIMFGSWDNVGELVKHRKVLFDNDDPGVEVSPDLETKRTRGNTKTKDKA